MKRNSLQAIRGMNDYLPEDMPFWNLLEETIKRVLVSYGYSEIRLPILEKTQLFKRAIGEVTDVVEKEMYTFIDRNGDSLTLRPEGTAGCVRAGIEHGLLYHQKQRLWYTGPMFRHDRPQKGRYRQFHQLGIEAFGNHGPDIDAELIILTARCWRALNISNHVELQLNSIGSRETRTNYYRDLMVFLRKHEDHLDNDCRRRMNINPMRVLDTKNADIQSLLSDAPVITDYLDNESQSHFYNLCKLLTISSIPYIVNPRLVRGIDYYNRTVFEWVTSSLGAQGTVCAGGRYDSLVKQLGGSDTPAVGCAMGLERLVLMVQSVNSDFALLSPTDAYIASVGDNNSTQGLVIMLAESVRDALPYLRIMTNYKGGSLQKQCARAKKHGARVALFIEEKEAVLGHIILKDLFAGTQEIVTQNSAIDRLISTIYR